MANLDQRGRLVLVPNTLDFGLPEADIADVLPRAVLKQAAALEFWVAENAKSARAFLKRVAQVVPLSIPLQNIHITELPRAQKGHGRESAIDFSGLIAPTLSGHDVGLISEAGLPAVADPGAALVAQAHAQGVAVHVLPGSNSLMLALSASGLNGQQFVFVGYLPVQAPERATRLRELEAQSARLDQTVLVIETPYRNQALLDAMVTALDASTRLAVSAGLCTSAAWTRSAAVRAWREEPSSLSNHIPAVFALLAAKR